MAPVRFLSRWTRSCERARLLGEKRRARRGDAGWKDAETAGEREGETRAEAPARPLDGFIP